MKMEKKERCKDGRHLNNRVHQGGDREILRGEVTEVMEKERRMNIQVEMWKLEEGK